MALGPTTYEDWGDIPDPLTHRQDDWIKPARVKGRREGNPSWGIFEE